MTEEFQQEHSEDTMFQDAVAALRKGDKARAKELLTLLLKADQHNPTYWIWLSAAMDTAKERVYCLQTALKLAPENTTAKRGLILLGALPPDETIQPFSLNRPRAWEEKLLLATEKPREKGFKAFAKSPIVRLGGIGAALVGLIAVVMFVFVLPRRANFSTIPTNTPGPSPTFTATPTLFGATAAPTGRAAIGPTPLWMLLPATYTPTAVYVNTPRAGQSADQYRVAQAAYLKGDWDAYITSMKLIIPLEPDAADIHYLIGEAYRFKGDSTRAIASYNDALEIDPNFAAPYLGLARAELAEDPRANVTSLYEKALDRDPNYAEVYIDRAKYYLLRNKPQDALKDLDSANALMPESPLIFTTYAEAYFALGEKEKALEAAEKAYSLDITALPIYRMLGELYIENELFDKALESLSLYVVYEPEDDFAFALLGRAYYETKDYENAIKSLDRAFEINKTGLRRYYRYRGLANLELNNIDQAVEDLEKAREQDDKSFDINFGLARAYYIQEKYGSAFLRIEPARAQAETEEQTALVLYWRALIQEKRDLPKEAVKDWQALLAMDERYMTDEMRATALEHLKSMVTPTPTPRGGIKTSTPTRTPTPARTPTKTPARTPTPTKTP